MTTADDAYGSELSRYYCPSCDCYFPMSWIGEQGKPPYTCPECGTALEYDDPLEELEEER